MFYVLESDGIFFIFMFTLRWIDIIVYKYIKKEKIVITIFEVFFVWVDIYLRSDSKMI